jgi:hypothetical protein
MIDCKGWPSVLTINPKIGSKGQFWFHIHVLCKLGAISWFENKFVSILSIVFSPINPTYATFAIWSCLLNPLEIPMSQMVIYYQEHMCKIVV